MSQPTRPMDDDDNDEPTLDEINFIFGPQNLHSTETVPMLERQLARLEEDLAALISHYENGADIGDHLRDVRHKRDEVRTRLTEARYQRDRLN